MARRSKAIELLEFEITFYEKLVTAYPEFVDALKPLAEAYTRRGLFEKGLQIDLRLTKLRPHDAWIWYNIACSYSLLNRVEEALDALQQAITLGYSDLKFLQRDPDLSNLRQSPPYHQFLQSLATPTVPGS